MRAIILDTETKVTRLEDRIDGSPFNPNNRLVTAHWKIIDTDTWIDIPVEHCVFYHNDVPKKDWADSHQLQEALDSCDLIVAHNAKYDIEYLLESGFRIPGQVWCTMIGEYVLARGKHEDLSLEDTAKRRYDVRHKKSDITHELFRQGIGYEAMPLDVVLEYGDGDVDTCYDIFKQQWEEFQDETKTRKLKNIIILMNEMLMFLVEIERNGVCIDLENLEQVRIEFETEREDIHRRLNEIISDVMGDSPINLNSGFDMTKVIFSREVVDRKLHQRTFHIGLDQYGKEQYPPRMTDDQFSVAVRTTTKKVYKTQAFNCPECHGNKFIRKIKKDGTPFKKDSTCKTCNGEGSVFVSTGKIAGFRLVPEGPRDASINGFKCGSDEIDRLIEQARSKDRLEAVEFLTKKKRLNAINTYLNSFVEGIKRWTRSDRLLHPSFNQCVARTGRLSSSDPNFQNQPKGRKFPVRKSIVSRWSSIGGLILEADFSGLEFVVAGELSRDQQIIDDYNTGKDVHGQTASIVTQRTHNPDGTIINWKDKEHKPIRDSNKPYTFAPLYGGQGYNEPLHIQRYFQQFFKIYHQHEQWQFEQMDNVVRQGFIVTPSGREYEFPNTKRLKGRKTTNATNIVNYPIQGFATGDIVPLACIRASRLFRAANLRSLLILTVHDSIVCDVYPGEQDRVVQALREAMTEINQEIKERWDYDMLLKLKCEMAVGVNWMEMEEIH
jgi:DNA polymerase I-like protein with 3'-5' exonuclease and polymerase domains